MNQHFGTRDQIGARAREVANALGAGDVHSAQTLLMDEVTQLRAKYSNPTQLNWRLSILAYETTKAQHENGLPTVQLRWSTQRANDGEMWNSYYLARWNGYGFQPIDASGFHNVFAVPENPRSRNIYVADAQSPTRDRHQTTARTEYPPLSGGDGNR